MLSKPSLPPPPNNKKSFAVIFDMDAELVVLNDYAKPIF